MLLTEIKTYILPQNSEGQSFAKGLIERNKEYISKFKESTTSIVVEITYHFSVDIEAEETK